MISYGCQRWNAARATYRPPAEPFRVEAHAAEILEEREARPFVVGHHYSGSYPAARLAVGLRRVDSPFERSRLVGVAVFSVPMQPRSIPRWLGLPADRAVELGRFVLLDSVEGNGETSFLRMAFRLLPEALPEVEGVLSYSDPQRLILPGGRVITPGHVGTIYRAHNGALLGRSSARARWITREGRTLSGRALSKIRNEERGASAAYDLLVRAGADRIRAGESGALWLERVLRDGPFYKVRHPGCLAYAWGVGKHRRRTFKGLPPAVPYSTHNDIHVATMEEDDDATA